MCIGKSGVRESIVGRGGREFGREFTGGAGGVRVEYDIQGREGVKAKATNMKGEVRKHVQILNLSTRPQLLLQNIALIYT